MLTSVSNLIHGVKIVLISSGVVSLAVATRFAVPMMVNFTVSEIPTIWTALISLFRPPYLYIIVNGIIIIIVASSLFAQSEPSQSSDHYPRRLISARTPPPVQISDALAADEAPPEEEEAEAEVEVLVVYEVEKVADVKKPVVVNGVQVVEDEEVNNNNEVVAWWYACTPPQGIGSQETETEMERQISFPVTAENPPVMPSSSRREPLKALLKGGKAAMVARKEREETLESVWEKIHEARRHVPQTNAFENYELQVLNMVKQDGNENQQVLKSDTYKGRANYDHHDNGGCGGGLELAVKNKSPGKIRKEPSLSQDELNQRAEAFIRKFNEEMRLQREESLKQHMNMKKISRGPNY